MARSVTHLAETHLGITDAQVVQLVLATAVSVHDDGDPLWPMLIGPSSIGKTTVFSLLGKIPHRLADDLTAASLLNQAKPPGKTTPPPRGILVDIGSRGLIVVSDFSTVLAGSQDNLKDQLFSDLRRVYDGSLSRDLAHVDALHWEGRATVLAACTSAIDGYRKYRGELGTRFVNLRMAGTGFNERLLRMEDRNRRFQAAELQQAVQAVVGTALIRRPTVEVSDLLWTRLGRCAAVTSFARTSIPRDRLHRIDGEPETEESYRFRNQLDTMARCALACGLDETEVGDLCARVARDSMPITRRNVLDSLHHVPGQFTAGLARSIRADRKVTQRALEDLEVAGMVEAEGFDDDDDDRLTRKWSISDTFASAIPLVFNGKCGSQSLLSPPPPPHRVYG